MTTEEIAAKIHEQATLAIERLAQQDYLGVVVAIRNIKAFANELATGHG